MKAHMMTPIQNRTNRCPLLICSLWAAAAVLSAGCGYNKVAGPRSESLERLSMNDFQAVDAPPAPAPDSTDAVLEPPTVVPLRDANGDITINRPGVTARPVEIRNPRSPTDMSPTDIPVGEDQPQRAQRPLQLLDAKVGDVNGKPIFTSSFFAPIEARLLAEADRLSMNEWRGSAGRIIAQRLDGIIADELLRAEALAALTPTQRVGLQAFLSNFRDNLLSENLGSSQLATRRIQEREGLTLDEALKQKEVDTLVQLTLIREINRRVNVSWRDIKQRYERDINEFSPPPTAVLRVIRAFKDDTASVELIQTRLESGEDFAAIAADSNLNTFNTDQDGMLKKQIQGSFEETAFFGPAELNQATQALQMGEQAGPLELGSSLYWIKLVDMEQVSTSLYDAQLKIQRDITFERREEAKRQYFARLEDRARVSTRDEVLIRLFEIAEQRYAPSR